MAGARPSGRAPRVGGDGARGGDEGLESDGALGAFGALGALGALGASASPGTNTNPPGASAPSPGERARSPGTSSTTSASDAPGGRAPTPPSLGERRFLAFAPPDAADPATAPRAVRDAGDPADRDGPERDARLAEPEGTPGRGREPRTLARPAPATDALERERTPKARAVRFSRHVHGAHPNPTGEGRGPEKERAPRTQARPMTNAAVSRVDVERSERRTSRSQPCFFLSKILLAPTTFFFLNREKNREKKYG